MLDASGSDALRMNEERMKNCSIARDPRVCQNAKIPQSRVWDIGGFRNRERKEEGAVYWLLSCIAHLTCVWTTNHRSSALL